MLQPWEIGALPLLPLLPGASSKCASNAGERSGTRWKEIRRSCLLRTSKRGVELWRPDKGLLQSFCSWVSRVSFACPSPLLGWTACLFSAPQEHLWLPFLSLELRFFASFIRQQRQDLSSQSYLQTHLTCMLEDSQLCGTFLTRFHSTQYSSGKVWCAPCSVLGFLYHFYWFLSERGQFKGDVKHHCLASTWSVIN